MIMLIVAASPVNVLHQLLWCQHPLGGRSCHLLCWCGHHHVRGNGGEQALPKGSTCLDPQGVVPCTTAIFTSRSWSKSQLCCYFQLFYRTCSFCAIDTSFHSRSHAHSWAQSSLNCSLSASNFPSASLALLACWVPPVAYWYGVRLPALWHVVFPTPPLPEHCRVSSWIFLKFITGVTVALPAP